MKRLVPLLLALAAAPAAGQTTTVPYVFVTVDSVSVQGNEIAVTGMLEGESVPAERYKSVNPGYGADVAATVAAVQNCQRLALMAMAKPGQYRFEMVDVATYLGGLETRCKLSRVVP